MLIHHATMMALIARAATRLEEAGKPNDQLIALLRELEAISEQAEAKDEHIKRLLDLAKASVPEKYWTSRK